MTSTSTGVDVSPESSPRERGLCFNNARGPNGVSRFRGNDPAGGTGGPGSFVDDLGRNDLVRIGQGTGLRIALLTGIDMVHAGDNLAEHGVLAGQGLAGARVHVGE